MNHEVQVFEIAPDAKPADRPRAVQGFAVSGDTLEDARRAALERLRAPVPRARRVRGGR